MIGRRFYSIAQISTPKKAVNDVAVNVKNEISPTWNDSDPYHLATNWDQQLNKILKQPSPSVNWNDDVLFFGGSEKRAAKVAEVKPEYVSSPSPSKR